MNYLSKIGWTVLSLLLCAVTLAQNSAIPGTPAVQRRVQDQTIVSEELPAAVLTFDKAFRYVGGQVVNLYGNADAEQHLFVKSGGGGSAESFYWVQFEHFLPSNT